MKFEIELKKKIKEKYGSVRAFSQTANIPYSTIDNIFKRGIMGVSVQVVLKICSFLNIDIEKIQDDELVEKKQVEQQLNRSEEQLLEAYRNHPEMQPAVNRILNIEDTSNIPRSIKPPVSAFDATEQPPITIEDDLIETFKRDMKRGIGIKLKV